MSKEKKIEVPDGKIEKPAPKHFKNGDVVTHKRIAKLDRLRTPTMEKTYNRISDKMTYGDPLRRKARFAEAEGYLDFAESLQGEAAHEKQMRHFDDYTMGKVARERMTPTLQKGKAPAAKPEAKKRAPAKAGRKTKCTRC